MPTLADKLKARRVQAAVMRAAYADRNFPRLKAAFKAALLKQLHEYARGIKSTAAPKISAATLKRWAADLDHAQRRMIFSMASHGWHLAGEELSHQSRLRGKTMDTGGIIAGAEDPFLTATNFSMIDKWIKTTSEGAAKTSGKIIEGLFLDAATEGLTPPEIAQTLLSSGQVRSESRAAMLAHTGAMWSYNEGAVDRYSDEGVAVLEWLTADDDLRCPFCADMNGTQIQTGDNFFDTGEKFALPGVGALSLKFETRHPPLHPNCRCTVIPIVDAGQ